MTLRFLWHSSAPYYVSFLMQAHVILHDEHTCIHADMHNMLYDILWDPHVVYNTILDDTYIYGKYIYIYIYDDIRRYIHIW